MKLSEAMRTTGCEKPPFDAEITGITDKPGNVRKGSVFVCIKGKRFDGHSSVPEAVQNGAAAVICMYDTGAPNQIIVQDTRLVLAQMLAVFYGLDRDRIKLIGITGTNGKTSTSFFLRHILDSTGKKTGLLGTLGALYNGQEQQTDMTTPEPEVLFRMLAEMAETGCEYCVAEVSSQALSQHRCASLVFDTAVFTNLGRDHLDYHPSFDDYKRAKAKLFARSKKAVLNSDDNECEFMADNCSGDRIFYSANNKPAEFSAKNIVLGNDFVQYSLISPVGECNVRIPSIGKFSVYNSLAAITAAYTCGISPKDAATALQTVLPVPGRAQRLNTGTEYSVYIDYAHTPAALAGILEALRKITSGRLITVFGCGGDRDKEKRPLMGSAAAEYSDILILTDDNPRTENPDNIIKDILRGTGSSEVIIERDRKSAIAFALSCAKSGDTVLIAGKGHEEYQLIGKDKVPFGDAGAVFSIINDSDINAVL